MEITVDNRGRPLDWGALSAPQRIAANLRVLLRLTLGEVPFDRTRGLDPELIGTTVGLSDPEIRREVDRLMKWEPRAKLLDLAITHQADGTVLLTMRAEV